MVESNHEVDVIVTREWTGSLVYRWNRETGMDGPGLTKESKVEEVEEWTYRWKISSDVSDKVEKDECGPLSLSSPLRLTSWCIDDKVHPGHSLTSLGQLITQASRALSHKLIGLWNHQPTEVQADKEKEMPIELHGHDEFATTIQQIDLHLGAKGCNLEEMSFLENNEYNNGWDMDWMEEAEF